MSIDTAPTKPSRFSAVFLVALVSAAIVMGAASKIAARLFGSRVKSTRLTPAASCPLLRCHKLSLYIQDLRAHSGIIRPAYPKPDVFCLCNGITTIAGTDLHIQGDFPNWSHNDMQGCWVKLLFIY